MFMLSDCYRLLVVLHKKKIIEKFQCNWNMRFYAWGQKTNMIHQYFVIMNLLFGISEREREMKRKKRSSQQTQSRQWHRFFFSTIFLLSFWLLRKKKKTNIFMIDFVLFFYLFLKIVRMKMIPIRSIKMEALLFHKVQFLGGSKTWLNWEKIKPKT